MAWQMFRALDAEWPLVAASPAGRAAPARWRQDPALAPFGDVDAIVAALRDGGRDPVRADRVLAALAARAPVDDMAMRVMLQALAPGLVNVAKRLGGGRVDEELEAQVLVEAVDRIRHYPLDRRPRAVAANVTLDVFGRIARSRARDRARAGTALPTLALAPAAPPDPSVEVVELVGDALAARRLRWRDAELLLAVAVGDDTVQLRATREGVPYDVVHARWRRARNRLRSAATSKRDRPRS